MPAKGFGVLEDDEVTLVDNEISMLMPSNHAPSGIEREIIKQRIILSEQKSTGYYMQMLEAKRWIIELEHSIAKEARDREILHGSLSALRRLPEEVLSLIFQAYVLDLGGSPWTLTQVSFLFRRAAFTSHSIWAKIHLRHGADLDPKLRNQSGREMCSNLLQLQLALARSGTVRLDIEISGFDVEMAREIITARERWGTFYVNSQHWDHSLLQFLFTETRLPIPLDEVVLVGLLHRDHVQHWLNLAQPATIILKAPSDLVGLTASSWSARLRRLEIHQPQVPLHIPEILTMTASGLTHLSLSRVQLQIYLIPTSIPCPNLLELSLIDVNVWWQFESPKLRMLTLYPTYSLPEMTGVAYPDLKRFVYSARKLSIPSGCVFAPSLESLTLQHVTLAAGRSFSSVVPGWFQVASEMRLRQLFIDGCTIAYKELIDSLYYLKHLEGLHIKNTSLPVSFLKALGFTASSRHGILCPALRDMTFDFSQCRGTMVKETFIGAFEDVAKTREMILVKLCVHWPSKYKSPPIHFI